MRCTCATASDDNGNMHTYTCHWYRINTPHGNLTADHKDKGKLGLQYILAMPGLCSVAAVGDFGSNKYSRYNYKAGMPWMKLGGSCTRHLASWLKGKDLDPESKLPHLAHLAYDALMLLDYALSKKGKDDRYIA
jgi:hypothetical protein